MDDQKFIEKIRLSREITSIIKDDDLEGYVRWKRNNSVLDIHETIGRKFYSLFFSHKEYEFYGINFDDLFNAFKGDEKAIDHLCLLILEAINERKKLEKTGAAQLQSLKKVIPDTVIQYLILQISEVMCSKEIYPNHSYIMLLREAFKGPHISKNKSDYLRERQEYVAVTMAKNQNLSNRGISNITGVDHSTISRWRKDPNFQDFLDLCKSEFEKDEKSYIEKFSKMFHDEKFSDPFNPNYHVFAWITWRYLKQVDN